MGGLSSPTGLSQTPGLSVGGGPSVGDGLSFQGFGGGPTPPVITNGILQESSLTDFIMMENGTDFILQE
jgi:hypothetical protein